jgi:hypothetical protein
LRFTAKSTCCQLLILQVALVMGEKGTQKGADSSGFRATGTSSAAQLRGIGWSLRRKHVHPGARLQLVV